MKLYHYEGLGVISEVNVIKETGEFYYCIFQNGHKGHVDKNYLFKSKDTALEYAIKTLKERAKYSEIELIKAQKIHQKFLDAISACESELYEMNKNVDTGHEKL